MRHVLSSILVLVAISTGSPTSHPALPNVFVTARHVDSDFRYVGDRIKVVPEITHIRVVKNRGPTSVQVLVGDQLTGDFEAMLTVLFPSRSEPGARSGGGGTALPYIGFRSSDGRHETSCHAPSLASKPRIHELVLRREAGVISIYLNDEPRQVHNPKNGSPGYVFVHMNDVAKFTIQGFSVRE